MTQYEEKIKQIKKSTLMEFQQKKIYQGKGKPPILKKERVLPEIERTSQLDLHKYQKESQSNKKKTIGEEILKLSEEIETLKKNQIARIYRIFDSKPMNERNVKDTKILLSLLFGRSTAEIILERFLRDKQVAYRSNTLAEQHEEGGVQHDLQDRGQHHSSNQ